MASEVPSHVVTEDLTGAPPCCVAALSRDACRLTHAAGLRGHPVNKTIALDNSCRYEQADAVNRCIQSNVVSSLTLPTGTCWRDDMWLAAFGLHHGNVLDSFVRKFVLGVSEGFQEWGMHWGWKWRRLPGLLAHFPRHPTAGPRPQTHLCRPCLLSTTAHATTSAARCRASPVTNREKGRLNSCWTVSSLPLPLPLPLPPLLLPLLLPLPLPLPPRPSARPQAA